MLQIVKDYDTIKWKQPLANNKTYMDQNNLGWFSRLKLSAKINREFSKAEQRMQETIKRGVCYYGAFVGEFGHMLAHTAPFLMYLHKQGVKIIYCGMELHLPILVDENGDSIIHEFVPLRDFFAEVSPRANVCEPPADVQQIIDRFEQRAMNSGEPFWNIRDGFYYYFVHRHFLHRNYTHVYDLSKVYGTEKEKACAIFPRSKGAAASPSNGQPWDYPALIDKIAPYFDKVYVLGHPSQVLAIDPKGNTEMCISADNKVVLEKVSNCQLVVTQHSGVGNLGEYTGTQVLYIFKGGEEPGDIESMNNTVYFKRTLFPKHPLMFAFSEADVVEACQLVTG